ncbi:hypothetical protein FBZ85_10251 [Azospirillum brasilense]|uniref:hypothetical protein n=1 Tax=Azospirillum baldaniorum TaxID=1064539 RepID=UPI001013D51C|nr:hypothetical protein [Azospirillum baldaniorum]TWA81677.1 hypothetical protein FBZ85_10251 [Azospirillum brasilense]
MSRPKPTILHEYTDRSYRSEQVLEAEGVFAVVLDGKPVGIRTVNVLLDYPGPKYKRSVFVNSGHAFNLAERLNKIFRTDAFKVMKMTFGDIVTEEELATLREYGQVNLAERHS